MKQISNSLINKVLKSVQDKAMGYETQEITEEYMHDDKSGNDVLVKKKISKFKVPADIGAAKFLMDLALNNSSTSQFENMSEEELDKEAVKLFKQYKSMSSHDIFAETEEN